MKKLLFVCTGNTCRSPMAEMIAKDIIKRDGLDIQVSSAGISCFGGEAMTNEAVIALNNMGVTCTEHISNRFLIKMIEEYDLIVCMTRTHKLMIGNYPNVKCMFDYLGEDIPDPYGFGEETYQQCAVIIKNGVEKVLKMI